MRFGFISFALFAFTSFNVALFLCFFFRRLNKKRSFTSITLRTTLLLGAVNSGDFTNAMSNKSTLVEKRSPFDNINASSSLNMQ